MKKAIAFITVLALAGSLTACGKPASGGSEGQTESAPRTNTTAAESGTLKPESEEEINLYGYNEPVKIKYGLGIAADFEYVGGETAENNQWMTLYRENNIFPEILYEVDSSQSENKMSTAIMSGNYPDIICATPGDYANYARTGVIADITEVFEKYASDGLKEYLSADGGLAMQNVAIDGKMYGLPKMGNGYDSVPVMFIRQDWLDNLGLKIPETMEELKEAAHAFTYDDPDQNGANDTYGLAVDGMNILINAVGDVSAIFAGFGAYPGADNMAFIEDENGKITWGGTNTEGMKAGLTLLQEMYRDGSLAKDFITMDCNSIFEEAGAGRCGIWFAPMWGAMVPAGDAIKSDSAAHMVSAPVPDGLNQGGSKVLLTSTVENVFCISSKCSNPEVLIKLMNLSVQKLCHPADEEEFYKYYGSPETSGWKTSLTQTLAPLKNYDNYKLESAALLSGDTSKLNAEQLSDYQNMKTYLEMRKSGSYDPEDAAFKSGIGLYTVFGDPQGSYAAIDKLIAENRFVPSAYNSLPTDKMAENSTTLKKLTVEKIVKIITGESADTYDDFLKTWYSLGGQDVIEDAQAWADENLNQ